MPPVDACLVAIGVATHYRHEGLKTLLASFAELQIPSGCEVHLIVVDNSEDGGERGFVDDYAEDAAFDVTFIHEPIKGLSHARNRALESALDHQAKFLCVIDDDEVPEKDWLVQLIEAIKQTRSAAVSGLVSPDFHQSPPWWMVKGGFFEVAGYAENESVNFGHTSNVIIDLDVIRQLGLRFSDYFSLAGGEDTFFFNQLRENGFRTCFTHSAKVTERIVPGRASLKWLVRRWYRTGNTDGLVRLLNEQGNVSRAKVFLGGIARMIIGAAKSLLGLPLLMVNDVTTFRGIRISSRGAGFVFAALGLRFEEYRNHNR